MKENLQNIPRLYTALAQLLSGFIYILILKPNIKKVFLYLITSIFFIFQALLLISTANIDGLLWILFMLLSIINMGIYIYICTKKDYKLILYYLAKAFLLAEFIASLEWQIFYNIDVTYTNNIYFSFLLMLLVYIFIVLLIYKIELKLFKYTTINILSTKELLIVLILVIGVFSLSNLSFLIGNTPFSSNIEKEIFNIRTLVDFGGLAILFAYQSRIIELQTEKEILSINAMFKTQYDSFRNYQENIDIINIKYHDLKHQLVALRAELDENKRNKWIDNLEKELSGYKPKRLTGNSVLDALIDSKNLRIEKHKIKFTIVADGSLLNDMHVTDICTIFGNALDNAIEAVAMIKAEEKRIIHFTLSKKKNFIYIEIFNYFDIRPDFKEGKIFTIKNDIKNHGFGLKSITYSVDKYNGKVSYDIGEDSFKLKIMIPIN